MTQTDDFRGIPTIHPSAGAASTRRSDAKLLTADDVARMLGMRVDWVYAQSRKGRIPTVTLGRYRRYRREAIEAWIRDQER